MKEALSTSLRFPFRAPFSSLDSPSIPCFLCFSLIVPVADWELAGRVLVES